MENHIVTAFDKDLISIKDKINVISGIVETQLSYVHQSLLERDDILAEKIIERDKQIDKSYQALIVLVLLTK